MVTRWTGLPIGIGDIAGIVGMVRESVSFIQLLYSKEMWEILDFTNYQWMYPVKRGKRDSE